MIHRHFFAALVAVMALGQFSLAQEVLTPIHKRRPVPETHSVSQATGFGNPIIEKQPTRFTPNRVTTEYQPSYRSRLHAGNGVQLGAVSGQPLEPVLATHGAYRYVPHTRWETRTEETQVPRDAAATSCRSNAWRTFR